MFKILLFNKKFIFTVSAMILLSMSVFARGYDSDDFNFKTLIDDIEKYLKKIESENKTKKKKVSKRVKVDKDLDVLSYIYSLMILDNGFVDRSYKFSDQDLKKLRLLVNKEIKKRKENK